MTTHLLDASVVIALAVRGHEHHDAVAAWADGAGPLALCPISEGALVRFLVRLGDRAGVAAAALRGLYEDPRVDFWPDDVSYADADLGVVRGHRQVTDAYLVALVAARDDARLATLDRALAEASPDLTTLLP